jgi:hypothetical protein
LTTSSKPPSFPSDWEYQTNKQRRAYLSTSGNAAAEKVSSQAGATREQLLSAAQDAYSSASASSGPAYASVTSYLASQTSAAKSSAFDSWSESELKNYLDSYGVPVPQGSTKNQLVAWARNQRNWFQYGTTTPQGTLWVKLQNAGAWAWEQLGFGAQKGREAAQYEGLKAADRVAEGATYATNRAQEKAQKVKHQVREEL